MEKYYRNLANDQEKDESLRQAKLDYLSKSNAQKHPFYWAAFVNIGDPEALATGGSLGIWKLWALLGFGLIAWIFYIRRRARS